MWGEIISGGATLLGGLLGKKKQKTTSEVDYVKMAENAQAAGFNPLTAIRNGGSAGFTTTTSPTMSALPEVLGQLGGALGGALDQKLDPIEAKKREIDTVLLDRQLRQLKEGPQLPASFKTPRTYTGTKVSTQLAPRVGPSAINKSASVPANFIGPPSPEQYVKANGGMNMYIPVYDQAYGKIRYVPNPDLPELDQMGVPTVAAVGNEAAMGANSVTNKISEYFWPSMSGTPRPAAKPPRKAPQPGKYHSGGKYQ